MEGAILELASEGRAWKTADRMAVDGLLRYM